MFTSGASHMCQMHNSIFRGYNSIYQQAAHIKDGDKADFVGYCLSWYKFVKTHADDEEANLFPMVEKLLDDSTIWGDTHKEHGEISRFRTASVAFS
jgi:hemerythrin-like domain-containing protein